MDRVLPEHERSASRRRRIVIALVVLAVATVSLAATVEWLRPTMKRSRIQTARVERGAVEATLQSSGVVVPEAETVLSSPVEARVLRIARRAGDRVRAGDELVTLDTSASKLDAARIDERLAQKVNAQAQLRLKSEESEGTLVAQLEQKKLDAEIFRLRAEQTRKLRKEGLVSEQDDLAAATAARKTDIEIAQLEQMVARARRSAAAEREGMEMELRLLRQEKDESQRQLALAMTRADRDGVVTWVVAEEGATVRRGDVVARIADLSSFRVVATISDAHVSRLAAGIRALVKIDDATTVGGTIAAVEPRIENGAVKFSIALDQPSHAKLRNNLRVEVLSVTGRRDRVLRLRPGVLGGVARADVFVIRGDVAERVPARFGLSGEEHMEVVDGLAEGDEVVISNTSEYQHLERVRVKN